MLGDLIEVKHFGQGALRATLLHWGFVQGPLDSLTDKFTGKYGSELHEKWSDWNIWRERPRFVAAINRRETEQLKAEMMTGTVLT